MQKSSKYYNRMIVDEIYNDVLRSVTEEIELSSDWLLRKDETSTDARCLLIHYLHAKGLTRRHIEMKTGLSKTTVRQHINRYKERCSSSWIIRAWRDDIGRKLGVK